jgi:hypothetical protein
MFPAPIILLQIFFSNDKNIYIFNPSKELILNSTLVCTLNNSDKSENRGKQYVKRAILFPDHYLLSSPFLITLHCTTSLIKHAMIFPCTQSFEGTLI